MATNPLDNFTNKAFQVFGHEGSAEYYRRLKEERTLCGTRCSDCAHVALPPRSFCPACFAAEVEWVSVGEHATLHAFTTQSRALRFMKPAVIGVVSIPDVGLMMAPIGAPMAELAIGQPLRLEILDLEAGFSVPQFVPLEV